MLWIHKTLVKTGSAFTILFWILNPSFLLVNTFLGFSHNSFGKRQVAACRFSKEICANPKNTSTNRMRGIALFCLQKSFVNSKAFGVKRLRTYLLIQNKNKGRDKRILSCWRIQCTTLNQFESHVPVHLRSRLLLPSICETFRYAWPPSSKACKKFTICLFVSLKKTKHF